MWNKVKMKALGTRLLKTSCWKSKDSLKVPGKICCYWRESHSSLEWQGSWENGTHYSQLWEVQKCEWKNELIRCFKVLSRHFQWGFWHFIWICVTNTATWCRANSSSPKTTTGWVRVELKDSVKQVLDRLVKAGVLAPVDEPTDWVNQMANATKKDGSLRICIDPCHLNLSLKREH